MLKTLLFLATLGLIHQTQGVLTPDCETFENGCPVDFNINLLLPHETSCRYFYQCVAGQKVLRRCGRNTWFNEDEQACDHPENVDRTCEDDASPERPPGESIEDIDIVFLPNGCPANFSINWHLPHERYCNLYYHCVFGDKVVRFCQEGLQFNATSQRCDFPNNVNCSLPGGNYITTTTQRPSTPPGPTRPPPDFNDNGCPRNHSIEWLLPHDNCTLYYQCVWGDLVERPCPAGLHFNPIRQICDNPATAGCANFHPCEDDEPCSSEGSGGGDPPPVCPPGGGGGPECESEEDPPPGGDCPPGGGGGPGCEPETPPGEVCPPGGGGGPDCESEEDPPPGGDCPPGGGGGPGCEPETPPGEVCPPGGGGGPDCDSEEDPPPGGDCPPGGGGGPGCEPETPPGEVCPPGGGGGPDCDSEEDPPPGGDCPPGGGGGPGCEPETPPGDDDDCDDDPPPGPPGNRCEEECVTFPWAHEDCDKFWYCYGNRPVLGTCSNGLYFNPATRTCDFACYVDCDSGKVRITPKHEGLNLYIPWHKFDDSARQLLKTIGY